MLHREFKQIKYMQTVSPITGHYADIETLLLCCLANDIPLYTVKTLPCTSVERETLLNGELVSHMDLPQPQGKAYSFPQQLSFTHVNNLNRNRYVGHCFSFL